MSGKAYTMKEMKSIVDYLVEHNAYGATKGRKMWMDFSNSQLTTRSWQSLKETFLKRILPDIHNPYYKLTREQVHSFKTGIDVREKERSKLEFQTLSDDSTPNENLNGNEQPSTSKQIGEENTSGEDKPSKISSRNRSSVDTVILENCYETADDVLRDLESPCSTNGNNDNVKSQSKSLRDLITYSEPLTPMLQEVLHDFASDDSDSGDPKLQMVEDVPKSEEQGNGSPNREPDSVNENIEKDREQVNENNVNESDKFTEPKVKSLRLRKRQGVYVPVNDQKSLENGTAIVEISDSSEPNKTNSNENNVGADTEPSVNVLLTDSNEKIDDKLTKSHVQSTQNCSSTTSDSVLPNNQEALENKKAAENNNDSNYFQKSNTDMNKVTSERAASQDVNATQIKNGENKNIEKKISITSDTAAVTEEAKTSNITKNIENTVNQTKEVSTTVNNNTEVDTQDVIPPNKTAKELNTPSQSSQVNPCLQSISLFAEQFNLTNYLDSESSKDEQEPADQSKQSSDNSKTRKVENVLKKVANDVVILKSHSDSESDTNKEQTKRNNNSQAVSKPKRDKVLANVFGFSSGGVTSKRKRLLSSHRKNRASHNFKEHNSSYESSEWTSESDSDYVSPPRGRRHRQGRKYLKPKSARIHALEDEGGLFVMYGKKIYPLVKDGATIKNYLIYSPDSDPDKEENYWKQKYVEERNRVEELKKLIKHSKKSIERDSSPLLPTYPSRTKKITQKRRSSALTLSISDSEKDAASKEEIKQEQRRSREIKEEAPVVESKNKTLKITFAKNNQEVHLEGHWSQLHPVLADVVEIFHKDTDSNQAPTKKPDSNLPIKPTRAKSPVVLTPIDEEIREKVNRLETEIFKEIEERERADEQTDVKEDIESNVTKRKRPNKAVISTDGSITPESTSVPKRAKTTKTVEEDKNVVSDEKEAEMNNAPKVIVEEEKTAGTPMKNTNSKASVASRKRTPIKEPKSKESVKAVASIENKRTRKPKIEITEEKKKSEIGEDDVRYMFPPTRNSTRKSLTSIGKANRPTKRYSIDIRSTSSPLDSSQHSESTQGYRSSDISPPKLLYRRKRKLSLSIVKSKNKNKQNRMKRSLPIIFNEHSSDSNSSYHIGLRPSSNNCSLKSDDYRSESYQMLMSNRRNIIIKPLEKIEEGSPSSNNIDLRNTPCNSEGVKDKICHNITNDRSPSSANSNIDVVNSSSVSLPLSPELSMVENLSVSKELVSRLINHAALNELQSNDAMESVTHNKYLMSQVDVTMPLMQQECGVQQNMDEVFRDSNQTENPVSETFLNKINTVKIKEAPSLSDSLDTRLKKLLLESAKKMSICEEPKQDIPNNNEEIVKKTRSKRCSTPRKKKETQAPKGKAKARKVDPVIEEEFMESCSFGGRKSCPPIIHVIGKENAVKNILKKVEPNKDPITKDKTKQIKKKDIIKVKITRPSKNKKTKSASSPIKAITPNKLLRPTNSDVNDNESGISESIQEMSDGIDLIHNHSDTCLQANECVGDSVEFLEMTAKSIISINSNSTASCDCKTQQSPKFHDCPDISLFCNNGQDVTSPFNLKTIENVRTKATSETVYHSPSAMSQTSLITEDLSDEHQPTSQSTKWYLLSEDETNTCSQHQSSFGANLKQIFPITCAVPNLSTITETSKENYENSRKRALDASSNTLN